MLAIILNLSAAVAADDVCADRQALAQPAAAGTLTPEQDSCLQRVVDRGQPADALDAAKLLWRHLRASGSSDDARYKALRAVLDSSASQGSVMFFAKGHVGQTVLVDGVDIGRAPARVSKLAEGPHLVEVKSQSDTLAFDIEVEVDPGATTVVALE